jgi:hypothetical protein
MNFLLCFHLHKKFKAIHITLIETEFLIMAFQGKDSIYSKIFIYNKLLNKITILNILVIKAVPCIMSLFRVLFHSCAVWDFKFSWRRVWRWLSSRYTVRQPRTQLYPFLCCWKITTMFYTMFLDHQMYVVQQTEYVLGNFNPFFLIKPDVQFIFITLLCVVSQFKSAPPPPPTQSEKDILIIIQ